MSAARRDIVTYEAALDAFAKLEERIGEESDAVNLLDFLVHISTLLELLEEQIEKVQRRIIQ